MGIESASPADPDLPALDKLVDSSLIPTAASARASNYSPELPSEAPPARHRETPAPAKNVSDTPPAVPAFREMHASRAAGLLFLLALLTRLGFGEWSAALSQAQAQSVAFGVLRKALRRLRVADEDPAHAMLAAWPIEALPCGPIDTPGSWRDPRIALQVPDAPDSDVLAALWLTACRRSLRRAARIGLASLVLRPGKLAWSLTHIDVYLDMRDLDLRVRRNALDIDPGWLSWLARVVSFHYEPGLRT
jgi:hypothetical protein